MERTKKKAGDIRGERDIYRAFKAYASKKHPNLLIRFDSGGAGLAPGAAVLYNEILNKHTAGWPDCFIAEPVGEYHGLFIEFKQIESNEPAEHTARQSEMAARLKAKGYQTAKARGLFEALDVLERYLTGQPLVLFEAAPF